MTPPTTQPNDIRFTELAQFQQKQKEAWYTLLRPDCKYLLYGGAAYGGKSYFLRWSAIGLGMYYYAKYGFRNVPIGLFSEDYPTLKDRQVVKIKHEIPSFLGKLVESRDEGYAFISTPAYGSFIVLLRNLDDPSKYSSVEFAAVLVEELTKNSESTFDDLRFRLRYPRILDPKFIGVTNPGGVGHGFVKRKWVKPDTEHPDVEQDRFLFISAKYNDNKFTTEDYVKQLDSLPEDKRRAYKEGDWDIFAGQFFSEWRDASHTCSPFIPKKGLTIIGGMDWGRSKPFSFHLAVLQLTTVDDTKFYRVFTFFEVYGTEKTPKEWAKIIIDKLRFFHLTPSSISWIQGDPAMFTKGNDMSISIADQFRQNNVTIQRASNDRIGGWENMHKWLSLAPDGLPYWIITENCKNLIRTLPELVHDDNIVEDVDTEGEDHAGDDQRYMLKRLKWIDAGRVGGIGTTKKKQLPKQTALMDEETGKQIAIDLSKFEVNKKRVGKPFYPR